MLPKTDNEIIKAVADTLTDAPIYEMVVKVRVPEQPEVPKRTLMDRFLRKPLPPIAEPELFRTLIFYPCVVANQYRIAGECALLPEQIWQEVEWNIPLLVEHQKRIVYIIAAALQNNHLEPEPALITFLERNMSGKQLARALVASYQTLNMEDFIDSIILMRAAVKILQPEMSQN